MLPVAVTLMTQCSLLSFFSPGHREHERLQAMARHSNFPSLLEPKWLHLVVDLIPKPNKYPELGPEQNHSEISEVAQSQQSCHGHGLIGFHLKEH